MLSFMRLFYSVYIFFFLTGEIVPLSERTQEPIHAKEKLYLDTLAKIQKDRGINVNVMETRTPRDMKQKRKSSVDYSLEKSSSTPGFKTYLCSLFQDFICLKEI